MADQRKERFETYQRGRTLIERGRELKIKGERGTFRFLCHVVVTPADKRKKQREWIEVIGGTAVGGDKWRFFRPQQISKVLPVKGGEGGSGKAAHRVRAKGD